MKKIPTLFQRDETHRYVIPEVTEGCDWVLRGEGTATRKFDGTCVFLDSSVPPMVWIFVRRVVKPGKVWPQEFSQVEFDPVTGKSFGWELYKQSGFAKYIDEALAVGKDGIIHGELSNGIDGLWPTGTYELCGPKINGNREGFTKHVLVRHGTHRITDLPLTFTGLSDWLSDSGFEGIVWRHSDGRLCNLKRRDFPTAV